MPGPDIGCTAYRVLCSTRTDPNTIPNSNANSNTIPNSNAIPFTTTNAASIQISNAYLYRSR